MGSMTEMTPNVSINDTANGFIIVHVQIFASRIDNSASFGKGHGSVHQCGLNIPRNRWTVHRHTATDVPSYTRDQIPSIVTPNPKDTPRYINAGNIENLMSNNEQYIVDN
eukprot:128009_1